jgi:four helix bundle protein
MGQHDGFRGLQVWQRSKDLAVTIYTMTREGAIARDFGLIDQIRRAAVSIPSNIAEGDERETNKESVRFLYIAKGSLAELRTQLEITRDVGLYHTR